MSAMTLRSRSWKLIRRQALSLCCVSLLMPAARTALAQEVPAMMADSAVAPGTTAAQDSTAAPDSVRLPPDQLDALVAPIALYPDELLAQTLVASTYPLEIVQLQQWLAKHPDLKDKALVDSVSKQPWDPSIQSMAAVPEVVKRLADDIQWTTQLGNAFLAQQGEVMDAVQRMRTKAKANGALESNEQQKVDTTVVENKTVIVVESTNPEVVYVPSYSPTVVYGPPVYPYPPIYYPYYPPGAAFVTFSVGFMMGAAMWGGSCCHAGWGGNTVIINNNNNFNQINHNGNRGQNGNWQHNPSHRGGTPYGDRKTASQYGGSGRGGPSAGTQPGGGQRGPGAGGGPGGGGPGVSDRSAGGAGGRGGGDQVGGRDIQKGGSGSGGLGGGSGGYSGSSARSSSSRGSSSMGSRGGGGGSRGGGRRR